MKKHISSSSQSGSALFYILLGVILFAALSFTVSHINRGGGADGRRERLQLEASEILQYARSLKTAVQTVRVGGAADEKISFENPVIAGYANALCVADGCRVFAADGGGLSYMAPSTDWLDREQSGETHYGQWVFSNANNVEDTGSASHTDGDLLVILPWLRKELCEEINVMLRVAEAGIDPPDNQGAANVVDKYNGTAGGSATIGGSPEIDGAAAACFEGGGGATPAGTYHFFQVLMAQ